MHPGLLFAAALAMSLHLLPRPQSVVRIACAGTSAVPRTVGTDFDPGARAEIDERWQALHIGRLQAVAGTAPSIAVRRDPGLAPQAYRLTVRDGRASIESGDAAGAFYAAMTLAQLPQHSARGWTVPCLHVEDRPALPWRVLSDDVSRGPLPTMRYFEERIRTIAAFKMNGYSPYMEHVFASPTDPLPAPRDGITPAQLHELALYARRFHVALIPEQQSFAHMHNTLRLERYAEMAELPHGFLLAPNSPLTMPYLSRLVSQELAAVGRPPFFHIGSDETATLGLGTTAGYVAQRGRSTVYAQHIVAMNRLIAPSGARLMLWDDGIEQDPGILRAIPRDAVVVNWHYGAEPSFQRYIQTIARGGFEQMVAPGASNWNEIYPATDTAVANERVFIDEGKAAHVLGLFQTVWHDDGETLYEATWYPVIYAATAAWEPQDVARGRFAEDFPDAFFGVDDARYSIDVSLLAQALARVEGAEASPEQTDAQFWGDPFAPGAMPDAADVHFIRILAEAVEEDRYADRPPLHANTAFVMFLAARRFDVLGRKLQIGAEVRAMYADALAHARTDSETTLRDLFWCKYWMWELRDAYEDLAPLYAQAWRYESREGHLASNLERYHLAAQQAIERADAFDRATRQYVKTKTLPPLGSILSP